MWWNSALALEETQVLFGGSDLYAFEPFRLLKRTKKLLEVSREDSRNLVLRRREKTIGRGVEGMEDGLARNYPTLRGSFENFVLQEVGFRCNWFQKRIHGYEACNCPKIMIGRDGWGAWGPPSSERADALAGKGLILIPGLL